MTAMLSDLDIEFMRDSQDDIYELRTRPVTFIYRDKVYDDLTGELIGEEDVSLEVVAVITEVTIRSKDGARHVENGIEYEQGDIKVDVKIGAVRGLIKRLTRVKFDGIEYELLGGDKKGIGVRNRVEFIGREIA